MFCPSKSLTVWTPFFRWKFDKISSWICWTMYFLFENQSGSTDLKNSCHNSKQVKRSSKCSILAKNGLFCRISQWFEEIIEFCVEFWENKSCECGKIAGLCHSVSTASCDMVASRFSLDFKQKSTLNEQISKFSRKSRSQSGFDQFSSFARLRFWQNQVKQLESDWL